MCMCLYFPSFVCSIHFYRQPKPFAMASQMRTIWFMIFFQWIELLWISKYVCMCVVLCITLTLLFFEWNSFSLLPEHMLNSIRRFSFAHVHNAVVAKRTRTYIQIPHTRGCTSILYQALRRLRLRSITRILAIFSILRSSRFFIRLRLQQMLIHMSWFFKYDCINGIKHYFHEKQLRANEQMNYLNSQWKHTNGSNGKWKHVRMTKSANQSVFILFKAKDETTTTTEKHKLKLFTHFISRQTTKQRYPIELSLWTCLFTLFCNRNIYLRWTCGIRWIAF